MIEWTRMVCILSFFIIIAYSSAIYCVSAKGDDTLAGMPILLAIPVEQPLLSSMPDLLGNRLCWMWKLGIG